MGLTAKCKSGKAVWDWGVVVDGEMRGRRQVSLSLVWHWKRLRDFNRINVFLRISYYAQCPLIHLFLPHTHMRAQMFTSCSCDTNILHRSLWYSGLLWEMFSDPGKFYIAVYFCLISRVNVILANSILQFTFVQSKFGSQIFQRSWPWKFGISTPAPSVQTKPLSVFDQGSAWLHSEADKVIKFLTIVGRYKNL